MRFEAGESRPVEAAAKLEHAKRARNERNLLLRGNVNRFHLRLFAAYKDDRPDLGDLGGAHGGLAYTRFQGEQLVTLGVLSTPFSRSVSASDTDFGIGVGIGATIADAWHVSVGYESVYFDESFIGVAGGDEATLDSLEIGLTYRFGGRSR